MKGERRIIRHKMPYKPQHHNSSVLLHDRINSAAGNRKMDTSKKSDLRRKSLTAAQVRESLSSSPSTDGPNEPNYQSPKTNETPQKPASAANDANTSELQSSVQGEAPVGFLRTGVPESLPTHREVSSVSDVLLSQLPAYKHVLPDQLLQGTGLAHSSRQSLTAFSSVPSSSATVFGGSGVLNASMKSASLRVGSCTSEGTAPRSPYLEASVANGHNKGSRLPLSPSAIGTEIPNKELPSRDNKKRKLGSEAITETTDLMGSSFLDEGAVRRKFMMSLMESSTMTTPQASSDRRPTSTKTEEDHRVAAVSYLMSQEELRRRERERERLISRALTLLPSTPTAYGTGAYRSHLALIDHATPAFPPLVLPPILYGISNARLAQHLSLTSPALAQLNTRPFSYPSHIAMMNSDHLLALARLGETSRRNTRVFGEGIFSTEPQQTSDFSVGSEMSNSFLSPALRGSSMPDAQHQDNNRNREHAVHGKCFPLHSDQDHHNISPYQYFIRRQIEVFEATAKEAGTNAQGRNRPILPGQVGIRCRHCGTLEPNQRGTGAVYFPNRLDGVYQTAQKMASTHFIDRCKEIPPEIREKLLTLKHAAKSSDGGGKRYWSEAADLLGLEETESEGLKLKKGNKE